MPLSRFDLSSQEGKKVFLRHRCPHQVPLTHVATHPAQGPQIGVVLYSLGDRHFPKAVREVDNGLADSRFYLVASAVRDKFTIDLQFAKRHLLQTSER